MSKDETDDILQQTGGDRKLQVIREKKDPNVIKGIVTHSDHPSKQIPPTFPESSPYLPRDPKSEELMNNVELENHINRIGELLLDIKEKGEVFEPKTKIGIFNISMKWTRT